MFGVYHIPLLGSMPICCPGDGTFDWFFELIATYPLFAISVFVAVVGGCLFFIGRNIYNIFFKYKKSSAKSS